MDNIELLSSVRKSVANRFRNPFILTYIIVWSLRNWELIYSVFNFDNKYSLQQKLIHLKGYLNSTRFIDEVLINVGWTFLALFLTLVLLLISKILVDFSEKRIKPRIDEYMNEGSVVSRAEYDELRAQYSAVNKSLDTANRIERDLRQQLEDTRQQSADSKANKEDPLEDTPSIAPHLKRLLDILESRNWTGEFMKLITEIKKKEYITTKDDEATDFYISNDLIIFEGNDFTGPGKQYSLTETGKQLAALINQKEPIGLNQSTPYS